MEVIKYNNKVIQEKGSKTSNPSPMHIDQDWGPGCGLRPLCAQPSPPYALALALLPFYTSRESMSKYYDGLP